MKVAIYTRVSTDSDEQLNSLKNQQDYYIEYCRDNDLELYDIYADEGLTGTNMKREAFQRMIHDAGLNILKDEHSTRFIKSNRKPKFDYIITKDVSRFARNTNVMEVVKSLRSKKVFIRFQNANIDTKDENYQFLLNLFLNFAQQESIDRSQKVIFGLKQRAKEGKMHFGSERLFGYEYDKETKKISLVDNESEMVKRVFKMYTEDKLGSRQIADILNKEGFKTQNDNIWTANAIIRMLKNEKYTGNVDLLKYSYGDVTEENRQKKLKNSGEWEHKESLITAIIDTDTFKSAKEIMSSRTSNENRGINTPKNMFSKKIKCAKCNKNYIRSNQKQNGETYYFYACSTRRRTKECDNHSVTLLQLEKIMQPYCDGKLYDILIKRKETFIKMLDANKIALEIKMNMANTKRSKIHQEIQNKENEISKLLDTFLSSNDMVKKAVERKIEALEIERKNLETEYLNYEHKKMESDIQKLIETKNHIIKSSQQKEFTLEEVLAFVDHILIDGENVDVKLSFDKLMPQSNTVKEFLLENMGDLQLFIDDLKSEVK